MHMMGKSGSTREEMEVALRKELTAFVLPLKDSISKALEPDEKQH
jgi:hypothetical protein